MTALIQDDKSTRAWFFFTLVYLVIDYARPQDIITPLGFLKPGMLIILILSAFLLTKGKLRDAQSNQTKMIWLFIFLLALYIPFAVNNFFAFMTTENMFLFMPFILSTIICVNSVARLKKIIFVLICIMIYVSIYSLAHGGVGSGNYFMDENDVSLYINMWLPFSFFLLFVAKDKLSKLICLTGLITGISAVITSFSRGGFVGLVAVSVVCWLSSSRKVLSLGIIGISAILIMAFASDAYWKRIATSEDVEHGTTIERIESWKSGWNMFVDNPLGVGGNNYPVRFSEYQTEYFQKGMWGRVAHSLWFTLLPELGIPGIIIYFLIFKYNLSHILFLKRLKGDTPEERYMRALSGAFIASMAGYFASGTFLSVLYYPHYWYVTAILVSAVNIATTMSRSSQTADNVACSPVSLENQLSC